MTTFMLSLKWTDQGSRNIKEAPKRFQAGRELAKKMGVEIKDIYVTTGNSDLVLIAEAPDGDNVAKFALALSALGNVHTSTARVWSEEQFTKLIAALP